jgi:PPOX class probable F420-dependent enzyme
MPRRTLSRQDLRFLARERVVRLATAARDGTPWVVPVCHAVEAGRIYVGSAATGRKITNVRRTGKVSLVADRYTERWATLRGVALIGRAEVFDRGPVFERGRRLLYRKYPQYARAAPLEPGDSVIIRITPLHVVSWSGA